MKIVLKLLCLVIALVCGAISLITFFYLDRNTLEITLIFLLNSLGFIFALQVLSNGEMF